MEKPKLYHIVAVAQNGVIGRAGKLPWHFSADLKHFKAITMGHTIIMGRKTFESIGSKPLPGRINYVLSRSGLDCHAERSEASSSQEKLREKSARSFGLSNRLRPKDASLRMTHEPKTNIAFFNSIDDAIQNISTSQAFIIGGAEIFKQTLDQIDGIYFTQIHKAFEGDASYSQIPSHFKQKWVKIIQDEPKIEVILFERR